MPVEVPQYIREVVEQIAFLAREDKRVDKRSGVSQRLPITVLENSISNAERRALRAKDSEAVPRVLDLYAALPSITGKLELEYEGELKGGDVVARELIRTAVGKVFNGYFDGANLAAGCAVVRTGRLTAAGRNHLVARAGEAIVENPGPVRVHRPSWASEKAAAMRSRASAAEFILEGLYAQKRISRNEEQEFIAGERAPREERTEDFRRGGNDPRRGGGGGRRNLN